MTTIPQARSLSLRPEAAYDSRPRPRWRSYRQRRAERLERHLSWTKLCELEPDLIVLERQVLATPRSGSVWHRVIKPRLEDLVGWQRTGLDATGVLGGSVAYDFAYRFLFDLYSHGRYRQRQKVDNAVTREWRQFAHEYRRETGDSRNRTLYRLAIDRLSNGDVIETEYWGVRVALREDLKDERGNANAYWPDRNACCLCYSRKARGACSHELARDILRFSLSPPTVATPKCGKNN